MERFLSTETIIIELLLVVTRCLVESESLLNDGTAIVAFNLAITAVITGRFQLLSGVGELIRVSVGGVVVGLVLGWMIFKLIRRVDDYLLIETTLTALLAFGY
jgi:CPA1 family monovalent cation:H+ antiporter